MINPSAARVGPCRGGNDRGFVGRQERSRRSTTPTAGRVAPFVAGKFALYFRHANA